MNKKHIKQREAKLLSIYHVHVNKYFNIYDLKLQNIENSQ